jgi:hypothetical protein
LKVDGRIQLENVGKRAKEKATLGHLINIYRSVRFAQGERLKSAGYDDLFFVRRRTLLRGIVLLDRSLLRDGDVAKRGARDRQYKKGTKHLSARGKSERLLKAPASRVIESESSGDIS